MPAETPKSPAPDQQHDGWQQLAHEVRDHWGLQHPGVAALYENHVVPLLYREGLGHLAMSPAERAGGNSSNRVVDPEAGAQRVESKPTRITVEQAVSGPTRIPVVARVATQQLGFEPTSTGSNAPNSGVTAEAIPEDATQRQESERKKNTTENLRNLQKRFGERFVKGDLMEGGGYTGGAARELLAGFMDRPGFAGELKRIIPNRHGALRLLKDNHAYIQSTLEQLYKDDPTHERAPAKDPYELARSAGYALTGPFRSTSEFVPYDKQDFRPQERLCTFNSPEQRLKDYHVLWLRHAEVADTLPADQLTADTLSGTWKTYLKTIGRYDQASDSYDLAGLRPSRDDPYGTSSMSVQISRLGTHVSIKNRYNHTVGNPDNTLDSDLDHVAYGLKRAVYSLVGREDLLDKTSVSLAEGYIADNEGGIHGYHYEEGNAYYGDYEYIANGVVTAVDRGKYYMISPQLYVPMSGKGDEINLRPKRAEGAELAMGADVRFLYKHSDSKERDLHLAELRQAYAERDHAELTRALRGALVEQAASSHQGYAEIAQATGTEVVNEQRFSQLLEAKMAEWQHNGVIDYLVRDLVENGNQPNLLATPNVVADWQTLRAIAVQFGKRQPHETYVYEELYSQYSAEELSGQLTEGALRLGIVPSGYTKQLCYEPVDTQLATLRQLQAEQPSLNIRVPSVLEAITHWQTLRAREGALSGGGTFERTFIRHFDLAPKRIDVRSRVPGSRVEGGGGPYLGGSFAGSVRNARVLVG